MPKLTKDQENKGKYLYSTIEKKKLYNTVREHYQDSWDTVVSPNLDSWTEKESMLINRNQDELSKTTKSQVFDPRLATIVLERAARVMAQNPSGKAQAMSKDDKGKNMLMNITLDKWVLPNANAQFDYLIKNRLWDMYSLVYGVMFKLVDKVIRDEYEGPDSYLLPIRDCFPQPGKFSIADSDWFGVSTWVSKEWIEDRIKMGGWNNEALRKLLERLKEGRSSVKGESNSNRRSYIETVKQPAVKGDNAFKNIEIYTEYRKGRWITISPEFEDENLILRDIEKESKSIPIVAKYCFPLLDSIYGLGEFERGKTLQYAINSLINLYLDGVKFSIFPPMIGNPDGMVVSSLVREPGALWLETQPNSIREFPISPKGMETFNATYSFLIGSLLNQAGTTDTSISSATDPGMGKTPRALSIQSNRENSRDSWDRFMMEKAIEEEMKMYVDIVATTEKPIEITVFAKEIEQIAEIYPDVTEMFTSGERGKVKITKDKFAKTKFNYQLTSGSMYKADQEKSLSNLTNIFQVTLENYQPIAESLAKRGKSIDLGEMYERLVIDSGTQDWDKIIVDMSPEEQQALAQQQAQAMQPQQPPMQEMPQGIPQGMPPGMPDPSQMMASPTPGQPLPSPGLPPIDQGQGQGQFADPEIAAFAQQLFNQ